MKVLRPKAILPIFFLVLCAAGAGWVALHVNLHGNLGPQCELKENFASAGRPAYWHHCVCLGLRYNENPPPTPNADATRCFGIVKKSWVDTDEIALHEIAEQERLAKSQRIFEKLLPETQARVLGAYKRLRQGAYRNDYPYMLEQAKQILVEVDDYGETKTLETMARKAIDAGGIRAPETFDLAPVEKKKEAVEKAPEFKVEDIKPEALPTLPVVPVKP